MIFLLVATIGLLAADIGVTALAFHLAVRTPADVGAFWLSFWSGLAYSFWTGSLLAIVAAFVGWRLQETLSRRWRRSNEREKMRFDAIGLVNGLYAEFPGKSVFMTNSQTAARRFEAERLAAQEQRLAPVLADKPEACIPPAARRIYRRVKTGAALIFTQGSPAADLAFFASEFIAAYEATLAAAMTLQYRLAYHARRLNLAGSDDIRSEADRCFFLGKLLGYSSEALVSILAAEDPDEQRALPERYARLQKIAALREPADAFASGLASLRRLMISLRDTPRTVAWTCGDMIPTDPP